MTLEDLLDKVQHGEPIRRQDLSRLSLEGADLAGATFEEVVFPANLRRALLKESTFVSCDFTGCGLEEADLHLATLYRCRLENASFDNARLVGASFVECEADGATFESVEAPIATWVKTSLCGASFLRANLDRANLLESVADRASFEQANLEKATLYRADLRTADLTGANLTLTTLVEAMIGAKSFSTNKLFRTQLMRSELAGASFAGATLPQCNFMGADLRGASFEGARAPQCFFGEADLKKANLRDGLFPNAVFEKAELAEADFTRAFLEEACFRPRGGHGRAVRGREAARGGLLARGPHSRGLLRSIPVPDADAPHHPHGRRAREGRGLARRRRGALRSRDLDTPARRRAPRPRTSLNRKEDSMSAMRKMARSEATLESGFVAPPGGPGETGLRVRLQTGTFTAVRAKSCLLSPEPGDKVLCAIDSEGVYVIAVLAGRDNAATTIAADGDLQLQARGGRVTVCGSAGVDIAAAGPVAVTGAEIHVQARKGSIAVEELGYLGRLVQAEVAKVAVLAQEVDSVVTRLSQRAKRVFRFVEELDQTRAGTIDARAQGTLALRAENATISARVLAKVDGEQIHIG